MSQFAECFALVLQVCVLCLITEGLKLPEKITVSNITCLKKDYGVDRHRTVIWDGRALRKNCRIGFKVPEAEGYKFVVEITKFVIKDCSFRLSYFYGSTSSAKKIFNCQSSPSSHEVENVQYLYIQFDAFKTSPSAVELGVIGKDNTPVWKIWIGVLVVLILIGVLFCIKKTSKNTCDVFSVFGVCCCGLIDAILRCCHDQARTCSSLLCPDCKDSSNNSVTTQQPTSQSEVQSEIENGTTDHSRRSSISSTTDVTSAGALMLMEEPTAPPPYVLAFRYEHPPNECSLHRPPPSYDECVMD